MSLAVRREPPGVMHCPRGSICPRTDPALEAVISRSHQPRRRGGGCRRRDGPGLTLDGCTLTPDPKSCSAPGYCTEGVAWMPAIPDAGDPQ
jgi:hypothetical protein